jgi:hydroxyacylglutathione hydrolase
MYKEALILQMKRKKNVKKSIKKGLIAAGLILLPFVLLCGVKTCELAADFRKMAALETQEIIPGVFSVKDSNVNLYLLKGTAGYIAIDSGNGPEPVRKELLKLGIDPAAVTTVLLTHADSDHTGGLALFRNAQIYLPREEEQMIDGRTARFLFFKNKLSQKYTLVDDNQSLEIDGLQIKAILTPGHTPGATCYLVNGQYLFSGDTMSLKSGKVGIFSKNINMDSKTQFESLQKIARLQGIKYIFTAHHGYSDDFAAAFAGFEK